MRNNDEVGKAPAASQEIDRHPPKSVMRSGCAFLIGSLLTFTVADIVYVGLALRTDNSWHGTGLAITHLLDLISGALLFAAAYAGVIEAWRNCRRWLRRKHRK